MDKFYTLFLGKKVSEIWKSSQSVMNQTRNCTRHELLP